MSLPQIQGARSNPMQPKRWRAGCGWRQAGRGKGNDNNSVEPRMTRMTRMDRADAEMAGIPSDRSGLPVFPPVSVFGIGPAEPGRDRRGLLLARPSAVCCYPCHPCHPWFPAFRSVSTADADNNSVEPRITRMARLGRAESEMAGIPEGRSGFPVFPPASVSGTRPDELPGDRSGLSVARPSSVFCNLCHPCNPCHPW
jgi:hypothetical protein